ncbi:hypothetical protein [Sphaerisporangium rhizosphaerae]|uniref:Uncharacterized protein n=1 Tax=Sphaerisporangium rhizosphaerae TaxID=2269375 RepID=A0ABW2NYT3_9ACTN
MSVDLGVWYARPPLTPEEAARRYAAWRAGRTTPASDAREPASEPVSEPASEPIPEPVAEATLELIPAPVPDPVREPVPEPVPDPVREPLPEPVSEPVSGPVPQVAAFYDALTEEFPDLTDGDYATSPWATPLTVGDEFVVMSIVFPRAAEVCRTVLRLADRHDLVCFDPHPDELFSG